MDAVAKQGTAKMWWNAIYDTNKELTFLLTYNLSLILTTFYIDNFIFK